MMSFDNTMLPVAVVFCVGIGFVSTAVGRVPVAGKPEEFSVPLTEIPHVWADGEPSNYEGKPNCLIMLPDHTMSGSRCSEMFPYICYKNDTSDLVITECGTIDPGQTLKEAGYDKFSPGEPNNATGGEFCGSVLRNSVTLNDIFCENNYPFVCEKDPKSLMCVDPGYDVEDY